MKDTGTPEENRNGKDLEGNRTSEALEENGISEALEENRMNEALGESGTVLTALYARGTDDSVAVQLEEMRRFLREYPEKREVRIYTDGPLREVGEYDDEPPRDEAGVHSDKLPPETGETEDVISPPHAGTGTLPGLGRLMEDIRSAKVHCVVVRDFDGFGRNGLESAYLVETFLRYLNVRLIAVEDGFDSDREEDIQEMLSYCATASRKARSLHFSKWRCEYEKVRARRPDTMPNGSAPYGYLVSSDGKSYVPDEETAEFVRMIFKWALMGISSQQIAKRMELLGIGTPGQRRLGKAPDPSKWNAHVILKILQNPNYTGDIYLGRMRQAMYKSQARRWTDEGEWIIRRNTHEPLVSREDFDQVQEWITSNYRRNPAKE